MFERSASAKTLKKSRGTVSALGGRMHISTLLFLAFCSSETPSSAPARASDRLPNGEYTAPLQQTTQPSYVPQSVALSGPKIISHWIEGEPIPAGYHPEKRMRRGLVGAGFGVLGATYLSSVLVGALMVDFRVGSMGAALFVPVAGPFIALGGGVSATGGAMLVLDGLAQTAGLVMAIIGLSLPKLVLVRNDLGASMSIEPTFSGRGIGVRASF